MVRKFLKPTNGFVSVVAFTVASVLAVSVFTRFGIFFVSSAGAQKLADKIIKQNDSLKNFSKEADDKTKQMTEQLKQKSIFSPLPPRKENPIREVAGILGDEVLINGSWHKAGDKIGDAEIVSIEPVRVCVRWDGKQSFFMPIDSVGSGQQGGGPANAFATAGGRPRGGSAPGRSGMGPGGGMMGFNMSDEDRERFRQMREQMRQRFDNMSPEERQSMFGGMGPGFGPPPGGGGPDDGGGRGGRNRGGGGNRDDGGSRGGGGSSRDDGGSGGVVVGVN